MKPAISSDKFYHASPIATYVLSDIVMGESEFASIGATSQEVKKWFEDHVDLRIRFMYSNNRRWKAILRCERKRTDPRDFCKAFIRHWLKAYLMDVKRYQERHPHAIFEAPASRKEKQTA